MSSREIFDHDRENCGGPFTHIREGVTEPALRGIDGLYGAADVLSMQNAKKHRRILLALSAAGTLLTVFFLLYDEAELHGLILACGAMILTLFLIRRLSTRLDCHRKYLEYRVLAECLRCQFFLCYAGIGDRVAEILPWSVRKGIPWIAEVLMELPGENAADEKSQEDTAESGSVIEASSRKRPVLDCWIRNQKKYHEAALQKAENRYLRDSRIARAVLLTTVACYIAALLYELIFLYGNFAGVWNVNLWREVLKLVLGTMSAVTLFTGGYYGKMSLPDVINDHQRMIALYDTAEEEIIKKGETREILLFLAREFLNENSAWYAYQSKNQPEIII